MHENAVKTVLQQNPISFLAFLQCRLCLLLLRDILYGANEASGCVAVGEDQLTPAV